MRRAVVLALRWHADPVALAMQLTRMATADKPREREAAAEVIGWQKPGFLRELLSQLAEDRADTVETAALAAVRRHLEQEAACGLLDALPEANSTQRWCFLRAVISWQIRVCSDSRVMPCACGSFSKIYQSSIRIGPIKKSTSGLMQLSMTSGG